MFYRCLAALCAVLLPPLAHATADGPDAWRVVGVASDDVLNLRTAPNARGALLDKIPPDADGLPNFDCTGGLSIDAWIAATDAEREQSRRRTWCLTGHGRTIGWAAARYLGEGDPDGPAWQGGAWVQGIPEGTWMLGDFAGVAVTDRFRPKLDVSPTANVSGFTGCDRFEATYRAEVGRLTFTPPEMATRNTCLFEARAVDTQLRAVLSQTRAYAASAGVLALMDGNKTILATFYRAE